MSTLSSDQYISLFIRECKSDFDWLKLINHDSNVVTAIKQMYNFSHNAICFKYSHGKNRRYQFNFFCQIIDAFFVSQHGVIKLKRINS